MSDDGDLVSVNPCVYIPTPIEDSAADLVVRRPP